MDDLCKNTVSQYYEISNNYWNFLGEHGWHKWQAHCHIILLQIYKQNICITTVNVRSDQGRNLRGGGGMGGDSPSQLPISQGTGEVCRAKMWNLTCENKNTIPKYYFVTDWQCVRLVSLRFWTFFFCLPTMSVCQMIDLNLPRWFAEKTSWEISSSFR